MIINNRSRPGWPRDHQMPDTRQMSHLENISAVANQMYRCANMKAPQRETLQTVFAPTSDNHPDSHIAGTIKPGAQCPYYFMPQAQTPSVKNHALYDADDIRKDFPLLQRNVNGKPLVWLDNAATTQKPQCVIDALSRYYSRYNSNVHRGAHELARRATQAYEEARVKVRDFIGASSADEIIFTRGTTEAVNLAASSFGSANISEGDEIILTQMEHHSNIVPWQMLAQKTGALIKVAPINDAGEIIMSEYQRLFSSRTRMVAAAHVSNVLGTVNPIRKMADIAHWHGARILVDGAQSTPHMPIDVKELDADFFAFSGHKIYGPTGIGVLYGKKELLDQMPPYQSGGGMIKSVNFTQSTYQNAPGKFEAGTVNIADAVGMGAAIDYLQRIGMDNIRQHERELTHYLMDTLQKVPGIRLIGTAADKTSVVSFVMDSIDPQEIAKTLDRQGIAVRAGHHCAQPAVYHYGLASTARASLGMYNTFQEMDFLTDNISRLSRY